MYEKRTLETFISSKVALVVDDGCDVAKRKRRLEGIPICGEKRRKLFIKDFMCAQGLNQEELRTKHKSMFGTLKIEIDELQLTGALDIYSRFKTDDDRRESTDQLVFIVPGPPANNPENKHAADVFKFLKRHRLQPPKLGKIELSMTDLLGRIKSKDSFKGVGDNFMVFSSEKKETTPRMTMDILGGDTFFNKWPIPLIPFGRLATADRKVCDAIFDSEEYISSSEVAGDEQDDRTADECNLEENKRIPFPQEHDMALGRQMIRARPAVKRSVIAVAVNLSCRLAVMPSSDQ